MAEAFHDVPDILRMAAHRIGKRHHARYAADRRRLIDVYVLKYRRGDRPELPMLPTLVDGLGVFGMDRQNYVLNDFLRLHSRLLVW